MDTVQKIKQFFKAETAPQKAYDLWASSYDDQPDNLMLALDEQVFSALLKNISIKNKTIIDVGCGTGRHWRKLFDQQPSQLTGFDVSEKMLERLQQKFPDARTYLLNGNELTGIKDKSCDVIISTLTIAHIKNAKEALTEWVRVLKKDGELIITDYHPAALSKGSDRTFRYHDKTISIVNHVHFVEQLMSIAEQLNLKVLQLIERNIDDSVRSYYEKQNALTVFDKWKHTPIIYGVRLKRSDDIE